VEKVKSISQGSVDQWINVSMLALLNDIKESFNADESALFCSLMLDKRLITRGKACIGENKS
jgi:hypothetical protein